MTTRQVKATLNETLTKEMDRLTDTLGLPPSSIVKLAIRRLAQSELQQNQNQNQTASSVNTTKEAA
ncbi:MAG: hypothetical protein M3O33_17105 [Cyanobacteriota bacterium]|nr:hypothetical protein [Cyanobacteriota bacterium]